MNRIMSWWMCMQKRRCYFMRILIYFGFFYLRNRLIWLFCLSSWFLSSYFIQRLLNFMNFNFNLLVFYDRLHVLFEELELYSITTEFLNFIHHNLILPILINFSLVYKIAFLFGEFFDVTFWFQFVMSVYDSLADRFVIFIHYFFNVLAFFQCLL